VTTLEAPLVESRPQSVDAGGHPGGSERGTTTIAPVVFERLAACAAAEVAGVEGEVRTGIGRFLPWTSGPSADASVEVADDGVVLDLAFNVAYPEPVRQVAEQVRQHVATRGRSLTGRAVREVNITVLALVAPVRHRRRVR
jgi:uncharacterized alkaline shock family protein YloU